MQHNSYRFLVDFIEPCVGKGERIFEETMRGFP